MPIPSEADYCAKGGNFGPHNLWENRPGAFQSSRFVFATYHNARVRVFDIENPFQPRGPGTLCRRSERMFDPRPNRPKVIQSADCFVDAQGVMYLSRSAEHAARATVGKSIRRADDHCPRDGACISFEFHRDLCWREVDSNF